MIIQPQNKLVMIGDSITDCGRKRPLGDVPEALGWGYVSFVDGLLTARYPERQIQIINMGISGDTVRDLYGRWQTDVVDLKPDWLSICIGINDVWRIHETPPRPEDHVPLDEYTQTLDELVRMTLPTVQGLILMTPYFIETNRTQPMRAMMDEYSTSVRQIAAKHQTMLVDTQAAFDDALRHLEPSALAEDRVHLTRVGHMILTRAFLQAIEFEWF